MKGGAEMPCQGQLRLSDRNLTDILGPAPGVNEDDELTPK